MSIYLFVIFLILSMFYFIFGWKHDPYDKYKHELCFIKMGLYSTFVKKKLHYIKFFNYPIVNII